MTDNPANPTAYQMKEWYKLSPEARKRYSPLQMQLSEVESVPEIVRSSESSTIKPDGTPHPINTSGSLFQRLPTTYEGVCLILCPLLFLTVILPDMGNGFYRFVDIIVSSAVFLLAYEDGKIGETKTGQKPRYFYILIWIVCFGLYGGGYSDKKIELQPQTWIFVDLVLIVALLRASYTYHNRDCIEPRTPLFRPGKSSKTNNR
jgi:hypothetical protein